jgi:hypothetical protein
MKNTIHAVLALALTVPAGAQTWAQRAAGLTGARLSGMDVPAIGKAAAVPAAPRAAFETKAFKGDGLYQQAKAFADEVAKSDKALDAAYGAWRKSLAQADADKVAELRKERDYYAGVWTSIVQPTRDLPKSDARVTPVLQALYGYLAPLQGRVEKLEAGKTAAAKDLGKARDAANASAARLHLDDRKAVEELGLTDGDWAKVEAAVAADRKASAEYMRWVREAYDDSAAWAKGMKTFNVWAEQYDWVHADYAKNAKLAKDLMDKKLGTANPAAAPQP